MPELSTPAAPQQTAPPAPPTPGLGAKRKGRAKRTRNIIIGVVLIAAVAVGIFFLYRFLTAQANVNTEIQSSFASYGSIQSVAQGEGVSRAKETAAITLTQGGTVQEVYVTAGSIVTAGQPLYKIFSKDAQKEVETAQEKVTKLAEDLNDLHKERNNLSLVAPFSGKLIEITDLQVGNNVAKETTVATLVNDRSLKLSLYFSYAYENMIKTGQRVEVSIPAVMGAFQGTVEKINKVSYISPEGANHFEVVVTFQNPGTLTADMLATAQLTADDGSAIYPYESGKTEYYETRTLITEASGPLLENKLLRYANVNQGDVLIVMGSDTIDSRIREKQTEIEAAQEVLQNAQKSMANFDAVAPIDGKVLSLTIQEGSEVKSGETVIMISNSTTMLVDITVDDRNIGFVTPGMQVELLDYNDQSYMGTVTSIESGKAENGMSSFPVTLTVDNQSGMLSESIWLRFSFVTSQTDNCIVVPTQAVKYVSDESGETYSVVFVKADVRPENAVTLDLPAVQPGQSKKYPTEEEHYYPVPVETGLSDNTQVEITSGLAGDEEIFLNYFTDFGSSWG